MISDDKIREVRERVAILDVVSDYVSLRKSGANYQGICPFHGEKTPSFNVNPPRGIFHCFGCGVGGNAFSFIMRMEGLTFPDAVRFLAKRAGVEIDERPPTAAERRRADERDELYRITALAAEHYSKGLLNGPAGDAGRSYLDRRAVPLSLVSEYRLGFAPDSRDFLLRHLEQKGVSLELAEKLGLIRRRDGGRYYDTFRNRFLFTIADVYGKPIGFGGRVLDDSLPKYINSPESPIYHKSDILFGIDLAKAAMRESGTVIVVEGYFDHLALYQAGIRNVVATCGTALTDGHVKLLQRYAGKVYTLFDADGAGKKATVKSMDIFLDAGVPAHVIELPAGDDPDSFLKREGVQAFSDRLSAARPALEYFFRELVRQGNTGTIEGKVKIVEELTPRLDKLGNPVERDLYLREISRMLGVDLRSLQRRTVRAGLPSSSPVQARGQKREGSRPEEMLLYLMGHHPEVADNVRQFGVERLFCQDLQPVAVMLLDAAESGTPLDWSRVLELIELPEKRAGLASLLVDDDHLEGIDLDKAFEQCCRALERHSLRDMKSLTRELAAQEPDSPRYHALLREIDSLRTRKSLLS